MKALLSAFASTILTLLCASALATPRAYIANDGPTHVGNTVSVIDGVSNAVIGTVTVGAGPTGVAVHPAGTRVYVTNFAGGANSVSVIDTASSSTVATVTVGSSPFGIASNLSGTQVYVANVGSNSVSVIRTSDNTVVATVPVGIRRLEHG